MAKREPRLVSVVTPVHNGGRFLAECIESVLSQTYTRFEYVICDNRSTDTTPSVIQHYARQDSRIRLVHPERFLPQILNWNFAANQVSPDSVYLKFVHADDTIAPTCIEQMVALADVHPAVGMVGSLRRVGGEEVEVDLDGVPPITGVVSGRWLVRHQLSGGRYTTGSPTSTLLRRGARSRSGKLYDESYVHADDALAYATLLDADFGYVAEPLTFTRRHEASATAWCEHVGTWLPEHLRMALEFGPSVLPASEVHRIASRLEDRYALQLAKWTVTFKLLRERDVFQYHQAVLRLIDQAAQKARHCPSPMLRIYTRALTRGTRDGAMSEIFR